MRTQSFSTLVVLLAVCSSAPAEVLISPGTLVGDTLGGSNGVSITDQSGLSANYISGETTLAEAAALTHGNGSSDAYFRNKNAPVGGTLDFQLDSKVEVSSLALWNANGNTRLVEFEVFSSSDGSFDVSSLTSIGVGSQSESESGAVQFHSLAATTTQFIRLQINSYASAQRQLRIGEVAFGANAVAIPEASSFACGALVLAGAFYRRRKRHASAGGDQDVA